MSTQSQLLRELQGRRICQKMLYINKEHTGVKFNHSLLQNVADSHKDATLIMKDLQDVGLTTQRATKQTQRGLSCSRGFTKGERPPAEETKGELMDVIQ